MRVDRVVINSPPFYHEKHWYEVLLPNVYKYVNTVHLFRQNADLRYELLHLLNENSTAVSENRNAKKAKSYGGSPGDTSIRSSGSGYGYNNLAAFLVDHLPYLHGSEWHSKQRSQSYYKYKKNIVEKTKEIQQFKACTYNVYGRGKFCQNRLEGILSAIMIPDTPDIICLQEASSEIILELQSRLPHYSTIYLTTNYGRTRYNV